MTGGYSGPETQTKCTEGVNMKRFFLRCAQSLLFVAPLPIFLLFCVAPVRSQTNNYEFNDSHFQLTNNIQKGPTIREFLNMMGNNNGCTRSTETADVLPALGRSVVLLLVHGLVDCDGIQVLAEEAAGPF